MQYRTNSPKQRAYGSPMGGTTGVSLEQGLDLTDIPRGRPNRRPGYLVPTFNIEGRKTVHHLNNQT